MMQYVDEFWKRHRMLKNIDGLSAEEKIILRKQLAELANLAIVNLQIDESDKYFNLFQKISQNVFDKYQTKILKEINAEIYKTAADTLDEKLEKELINDFKKAGFNEDDIDKTINLKKAKINEKNPFTFESFKFSCLLDLNQKKLKNEIRQIVFNHDSDLEKASKDLDKWVDKKIAENLIQEKEAMKNMNNFLKDPKDYLQDLKHEWKDDHEMINFEYGLYLEKFNKSNKSDKEVMQELEDKWWSLMNDELKNISDELQENIYTKIKEKNMIKNEELQFVDEDDLSGLTEEIEKPKKSAKNADKNQKMIPMPADMAGFLFGEVKVLENKTNGKKFCTFKLRIPRAEVKEDGKKTDYFLNCISSEKFFKNSKIGNRALKEGDFIKAWGGLSIKNYFSKDKNCNLKDFKFKALKMNDYKSRSEMKRANDKASQNAEEEQLSK